MKNLILALFIMAGTAVMAQSNSADLQKKWDITAEQANDVASIQAKYCNPSTGCNLPEGKTKADYSEKELQTVMKQSQQDYYAALVKVVPKDVAKKMLDECEKECSTAMSKSGAKGKSCCPHGEAKASEKK